MRVRPILLALLVAAGLAAGPPLAARADQRLQPLGDGRVSSAPRVGYLWLCRTRFATGTAAVEEPWIRGSTWDPAAKPVAGGRVAWPEAWVSVTVEGVWRVIRGDGLPSHPTGAFPIRTGGEARRYARSTDAIRSDGVLIVMPANPRVAAHASCVPAGPVGYALDGVAIFGALDAAGHDAAAHRILDACHGHPDAEGRYHYHDFSPCLADPAGAAGRHSDLVGYALDGFGIYGPHGEGGAELTDADLDACHGHTHEIEWNGRRVRMYHYHFTREYPYSVGCFRGSVESAPPARPALVGPRSGVPHLQIGRPPFGGAAPAPVGAVPSGAAGAEQQAIDEAAQRLGVSPGRLRSALGPSPPNFERAAKRLGVTEPQVRRAWQDAQRVDRPGGN